MKENATYLGKLSFVSLWSFLKIIAFGFLSTWLIVCLGFWQLYRFTKNIEAYSGDFFLSAIFQARTPSAVALCLILIISPIIYFFIAKKYATEKAIYNLIQNKSEALLLPILDKIIQKFKTIQPAVMKDRVDYPLLKLRFIQQIKENTNSAFIRNIILFIFNKLRLNGIDFSQDYTDIIKTKALEALKDIDPPSKKIIWITLLVQCVVLLMIYIVE